MHVCVCVCRPIQPDVLNKYHFVAISIMTFVGGYFGAVLGNAMMAETYGTYALTSSYYKASAVPCRAVLCCAVLCCAVLCHAQQFCAWLCGAASAHAVLCQVLLCCTMATLFLAPRCLQCHSKSRSYGNMTQMHLSSQPAFCKSLLTAQTSAHSFTSSPVQLGTS